jgi:hypothetical protein
MYKDKNGQETEISTIVKKRSDLDGAAPNNNSNNN